MNTYLKCVWGGQQALLEHPHAFLMHVQTFSHRGRLSRQSMPLSNKGGKCRTRHSRAALSNLTLMLSPVLSLIFHVALCIHLAVFFSLWVCFLTWLTSRSESVCIVIDPICWILSILIPNSTAFLPSLLCLTHFSKVFPEGSFPKPCELPT